MGRPVTRHRVVGGIPRQQPDVAADPLERLQRCVPLRGGLREGIAVEPRDDGVPVPDFAATPDDHAVTLMIALPII